jgi:hypothetical protein
MEGYLSTRPRFAPGLSAFLILLVLANVAAGQVQMLDISVSNAGFAPGSKTPARVKIDFRKIFSSPDARVQPASLKLWRLKPDGAAEADPVPARFDDPDPRPTFFFYTFTGSNAQCGYLVFQHTAGAEPVTRYRLDFRQWQPADGPPGPSCSSSQIGDFDVLRYPRGGPMSGLFQTKVTVADWYGNGRQDLICSDDLGYVVIYPRVGNGPDAFGVPQLLQTADGQPLHFDYLTDVLATDWRNRGKLDLIVGDETSKVWYVENIGTREHPVLAKPVPLLDSSGQQIKSPKDPCKELNFFTKDYAPHPAVFDYFGSGKNDLILGGYITGQMFLYENVAETAQDPPKLVYRGVIKDSTGEPIDVTWGATPCFADLDGDGLPDLITGQIAENKAAFNWHNEPSLIFYKNTGTRHEPVWTRTDFGFPTHWTNFPPDVTVPRIVDWEASGLDDIIMSGRCEVFYFKNIGTKTRPKFEFRERFKMPYGPLLLSYAFNAISPCLGDLNGDGLPDLVRGGAGSSVWARMIPGTNPPEFEDMGYLSTGQTPIYHEFKPGDDTSFPFLYDWDHKGKLDLILGDGYGYVWRYRNVGTKNSPDFAPGEKLQLNNGQPLLVGTQPTDTVNTFEAHSGNRAVPAPGDYVGDGRTHLIVSDADGDVYFFRNSGNDRFEPGVKIAGGTNRAFVYPMHWSNSGRLDLVVSWASGPKIQIFLNQGVGADGIPQFKRVDVTSCPPALPTPRPMAIDWDHDGQTDLLLGSSYALLHFASHYFVEHGYVEAELSAK